MNLIYRYTKLTKSEPKNTKKYQQWEITEKKFLQSSEILILRRYCQKIKETGLRERNFINIRNWFMIELGLHTGLRVSEIKDLKHGDLLIENDKATLFTVGKGNKFRPVRISTSFITTCQNYIAIKDKLGYEIKPTSSLLPNKQGNKISKRTLQKHCKQIFKQAGLSEYYHIHTLRHTYATFLLISGNYNYRLAQKQLGHSSIRTTQIYSGVLNKELDKAVNNLYKREGYYE